MRRIKDFIRRDKEYFWNNRAEIDRQNYNVLRIACVIYSIILMTYTIITLATHGSKVLIIMYAVFDVIHVVTCAIVFNHKVMSSLGGKYVNVYKIIFEIAVLSFFVLEAVLPYPAQQSIYFPFPILLIVIVFIDTPLMISLKTLSYIVTFSVMTILIKSPEVWVNEGYIAMGTLITALTGYIITAKIRHTSAESTEHLKILSTTDTMTGLNKKSFFETLCVRYMYSGAANTEYAMMFCDVDKFKQINDKYGHPFGDSVLKKIAAAMREVFPEAYYLCRYGGDEFVVFMTGANEKICIDIEVERFCNAVVALAGELGLKSLSCSVGVAMKSAQNESYSELLSRADSALYMAKKNNLGYVCINKDGYACNAKNVDLNITPQTDIRKRKILVVDDNNINRTMIKRLLSDNYEVEEAADGIIALDSLEKHKDVSAILLDIMMPNMDGFEFLEHKLDDPKIADIPVIITTVCDDEQSEQRALSLGAIDFVVKPYRHTIVLKRLENVIKLSENAAH